MVHGNRLFQYLYNQRSPAPYCSVCSNCGCVEEAPQDTEVAPCPQWTVQGRLPPGTEMRGGWQEGNNTPVAGRHGENKQGKSREDRKGWHLVYCFCGLHFSRGNLSGKDLSVPAPLECPSVAALTFLPQVPSFLSCRGQRALACRGAHWSSTAWLTGY